jgi:hypothetical protein
MHKPEFYVDGARMVSGRTVLNGIRIDPVHGSDDLQPSTGWRWIGWTAPSARTAIDLSLFGFTAWAVSGEPPLAGQNVISEDGTIYRIGRTSDADAASMVLGTAVNRVELLVTGAPPPSQPPYFVLNSAETVCASIKCVVRLLINTMAELPDYYCHTVRLAPSSIAYTDDGQAIGEPLLSKHARTMAGRSIWAGDKFPICFDESSNRVYGLAIMGKRLDRHIFEADLHFAGSVGLIKAGDYLYRRTGFEAGDQRLEVTQRVAVVTAIA